jgi:hypothetical protein
MDSRYPIITALVALLLCGAVGLFNYSLDPYLLFNFEAADSARLSRIDQFNHMRITKPWYLQKVKPTAVIVGSSRSARLLPVHESWADEKGYNLAVPGMTIAEMLRFIEHAHAIEPISKLMIGLDYEAFNRPVPVTRPGFESDRMAQHSNDLRSLANRGQYVSDVLDSLFSISAISRSLSAYSGIPKPGRQYFKEGSWETTTDFFTGRGGYIFIGKNVLRAHRSYSLDTTDNLNRFAEILKFCHREQIDTRLFFTPTHVFFVDLWHSLGYGEMWLNFHRQVAALNREIAAEAGVRPFPLWGFSDAAGVVNEPIYLKENASKAWYDDGVHTRGSLGRKMMDDVWGEEAEIGSRLTPENIEGYLERIMAMVKSFDNENQAVVRKIHRQMGFGSK